MMHEWLRMALQFADTPSISRAITFAIVGGLGLTQWFKFQLPAWLTDAQHERQVRMLSSLFTTGLCVALWPYKFSGVEVALALICGVLTPTAYWLVVRALYHYFPWTEDVLSARPTGAPHDPT